MSQIGLASAQLTIPTVSGGGAPTVKYVGADLTNLAWLNPPVGNTFYSRKFTVAEDGILVSIGVYLQSDEANVAAVPAVALYTHDTDQPGIMLAGSSVGEVSQSGDSWLPHTASMTPRWIHKPVGHFIVAGNYWMVIVLIDAASLEMGIETGAGAGNSGIMTSGSTWWVEKGATGAGWNSAENEYLIRGLFMPATL